MKEFNYKEITEYLEGIPQFTGGNPDLKYGVQRARILLDKMGRPDKDLRIVHVAGTNGKGSVCAYLSACLEAAGITTGLFTSPHLTDIRERIRTDEGLIPKEDFTRLFNVVYAVTDNIKKEIPGFEVAYFEYFLMIAMLFFKERQAECVILETGLGGRLDATNAVSNKVLSVITGIALEHTEVLGDSLGKIAYEKAGIIKSGVPVLVAGVGKDILKIFKNETENLESRLIYADYGDVRDIVISAENVDFSLENEYYRNVKFAVPAPAVFEAFNGATALTAAAVLKEAGVFKDFSGSLRECDIQGFRKALSESHWEGRMERIAPDTYLDGAHNPQGIERFLQSVAGFAAGKKNILLFSVVSDKNFREMVKSITESGLFVEYIIAKPATDRALSPESLKDIFAEFTQSPVKVFSDVKEAYSYGSSRKKDYLFCVGSLYLVGEIKSLKG